MSLCLPETERTAIDEALRTGKLSLRQLVSMPTELRRAELQKYVGEAYAKVVNAKLEQAMVSTQKKAFEKWVKSVTQEGTPIRRDMLTRVGRVEKYITPDLRHGFLKDLAEAKLRVAVTAEEAGIILQLNKKVVETRSNIPESYLKSTVDVAAKDRPLEAFAYSNAMVEFQNFTQKLKEKATNLTMEERKKLVNTGTNILDAAGATKSLLGSLDNSMPGRQGLPVLLRGNVRIWGRNWLRSFKNFKDGFSATDKNTTAADAIKSEILSRVNSINGTYAAAPNKYGLDVLTEEALPSLAPENLFVFGKFFRASSAAFNLTTMQLRADMADALIAHARKNGIDPKDPREASGLGLRVGTLTGRGELTTTAPIGDKINLTMFAPRFLRSRFNIVTGGQFYNNKKMSKYARQQAALDTVRIVAGVASVMITAKMLGFEVETDPRSSKFAQVCVGSKCYDTTGEIKGLATLAVRIFPTVHNGEWGRWTKSGATGKWTKMNEGEFGEATALSLVEQFFKGKLSPPLALARDWLQGQTFGGDKFTWPGAAFNLVTPIGVQNLWDNFAAGKDEQVISALMEGLGFSSTDRTFFPSGKRWMELKTEKGPAVQQAMLKEATEKYNARVDKLEATAAWSNMTNEEQGDMLTKIKNQETDKVLKRHGL